MSFQPPSGKKPKCGCPKAAPLAFPLTLAAMLAHPRQVRDMWRDLGR